MPELIYKRAGHLEMFRYRDEKRFLFNGVVQSLTPSLTNNTTEVEDGNSDWPYEFSTGKAGQVTVNLNSFQPRLYAALVAGTYEDDKTDFAIRRIEEYTVPSESPYTVTLKKTPATATLVIVNENDSPFVSAGSASAAGEYSISASTLTFHEDDAEEILVMAYDYEAANAHQMTLADAVNDDMFRVTIAGEAVNKENEAIVKYDSMTFDRMRASGEISMPPRQREPQGWNVTLKMIKPRPGFKVVDYRVEA